MGTKYQGPPEVVRALNTYIKLQRAADAVLTRTNAHLGTYDLTTSQFGVLEALHHLGTLSQRDLAEKVLRSTGNISTLLKGLEARGLITRERDRADNRYMQVCITDTGRTLMARVLPTHIAGIVTDLSILTPEEQDELGHLCRKLGLRVVLENDV